MEEECCPQFDPGPWDGKILEWENKRFIRDKVMRFFFIPLNFASVIEKLNEKVEKPERPYLAGSVSQTTHRNGTWISTLLLTGKSRMRKMSP